MIGHSPVDVEKAVNAGMEGHESSGSWSAHDHQGSSSSSSSSSGVGGGSGGGRASRGQGSMGGLGDEITNESTASDIAKVRKLSVLYPNPHPQILYTRVLGECWGSCVYYTLIMSPI